MRAIEAVTARFEDIGQIGMFLIRAAHGLAAGGLWVLAIPIGIGAIALGWWLLRRPR